MNAGTRRTNKARTSKEASVGEGVSSNGMGSSSHRALLAIGKSLGFTVIGINQRSAMM